MVLPVGPGKFYGSSLPRPRYFTGLTNRVDPPVPVLDPLLHWAGEAHWSMGGLSFKRLRLMGRIEGNVNRLRAQLDKSHHTQHTAAAARSVLVDDDEDDLKSTVSISPPPPPAPIATKRRRFVALLDEDEDEEDEVVVKKKVSVSGARRWVRKLGDDFDRVASENPVQSPVRISEPDGLDELVVEEVKGKKLRSGKKGKIGNSSDSSSSPVLRSGKKGKIGNSSESSPTSSTRSSLRLAKRGTA